MEDFTRFGQSHPATENTTLQAWRRNELCNERLSRYERPQPELFRLTVIA